MKHFVLSMLIVFTASINAHATTITPAQAKAVAQRFTSQSPARFATGNAQDDLQLAYVGQNKSLEADYYVFNVKADGGYIIVGGDDLAQPVWGYGLNGAFDFETLPDNMRWWLSEYQRQLNWLRDHPNAATYQTTKLTSSVEPLLSTTWDQYEPYNNYCPIIYNRTVPTGCLATALAQIMKYYNWPQTGYSDHSYTFSPDGVNNITLEADFSQSTYDWDNMLDNYDNGYNDTQAAAVAKLMSDVGIALNMQYGYYGSSAYYKDAIEALMAYFDYSTAMTFNLKDYYSGDWEAMLRGELDARRPVYYFGQTPTYDGHAFLLDGYDTDGYFHVNWGWGGYCDGYFLTSLLRPLIPEDDPDGYYYNTDHGAIIGIEPDNTGGGGILLKGGITPGAETMPANDVRIKIELEAANGPYSGNLWMAIATKNSNGGYSWMGNNTISINATLAAGERKTYNLGGSYSLNEGETYYLFIINPYITTVNYFWCDPVPFTVGDWPLMLGDVNNDRSVNIADVTALIDYVLGGNATGVNLAAADVNGNSLVNIEDVTALIDYVLGGN